MTCNAGIIEVKSGYLSRTRRRSYNNQRVDQGWLIKKHGGDKNDNQSQCSGNEFL